MEGKKCLKEATLHGDRTEEIENLINDALSQKAQLLREEAEQAETFSAENEMELNATIPASDSPWQIKVLR